MALSIGPGLMKWITANGATPISNEVYLPPDNSVSAVAILIGNSQGLQVRTIVGYDKATGAILPPGDGVLTSPTPPAPTVIWKGSLNYWMGGLHDVCAIVIHTIVGTLASCDSTFSTITSQVSAHYGVGLDGTIHQYVKTMDAAWANGVLEQGNDWEPIFGSENPNHRTISIETEDLGKPDLEPVSAAQYASVLALCRQVRIQWPNISHLVSHHAISPQSRSCPAARWLATGKFDQLAADLNLTPLK